MCRADLIVIDDIGLLPVGEDAAEAFYRIIDAAYELRSIAVTSNIHPPASTLRHDHAEDSRGRKH
ncbi:ATP-binding protein [Streptomyces bobili]|uniref:ATP-binding protein n=1 Tax=Streptomyces bobili TaxID=67280 RepID=UPI0036E15709